MSRMVLDNLTRDYANLIGCDGELGITLCTWQAHARTKQSDDQT